MSTTKKRGARLGQHFLTARWAASMLASAACIKAGTQVVEIGPGKGALTVELLRAGGIVTAVEKDEALVLKLRETFATEIQQGTFKLVENDVRDVTPQLLGFGAGEYVLAANIPYYITGEIIRQFLTAPAQPRTMALLIQKEVAQRITSKKESLLSLSVKAYGKPRIVEKVSRKLFSPPPSVDSAIIAIDAISKDFFTDLDEQHFFKVLHAGFSSKRKLLANNLGVVFGKEKAVQALADSNVSEKARAENVAVGEWKQIAQMLA